MANILCHVHFWTLRSLSPGTAADDDIGRHVYHDKRRGKSDDRETLEVCRNEWAESRGLTWIPRNRKPEKLRTAIKEYEELMSLHKTIAVCWKTHRHCLLLLENGILITFVLSKCSGDVEQILIDRSLLPRLQASIDNAVFSGSNILLTVKEDPRPACVSLSYHRSSAAQVSLTLRKTDSGRRLEKLSSQDPKVLFSEQGGMPLDRVQRELRVGDELAAVWWREDSPAGSGYNLLLFSLTKDCLEFCYGAELKFDPVEIQFSKQKRGVLLCLERTTDSTYQCCSYEYLNKRMTRSSSEISISSKANVVVCEWNREESRVLLGCESTTLILHDFTTEKPDIEAQAFFSPVCIRWHPEGGVVMVCGPRGELQCFDIALNPLTFQTLSDSPTPLLQIGALFVSPVQLELAEWGTQLEGESTDNFLLTFDRGPVVLVRIELGVVSRGHLEPAEIVSEYIRDNQTDKAVSLLGQLCWSYQPAECFICITLIMDHLLTEPLTRNTEEQMLSCLEFFESDSVTDDARFDYQSNILHLTRRFFHLLIRHRKLERAIRIAERVGAQDLFMDIHFLAVDLKNSQVAHWAKQKAKSYSLSDFTTDVLQAAGISQET